MKTKTGYDLNYLLKVANFLICAGCLFLYIEVGSNQYVNGTTIALLCLFGVQNFLILSCEKKKSEPFVLLLMIITLIFYMGRVASLLYDPWSSTLSRGSFVPGDLNYSLLFIMLSNLSICLGLFAAGRRSSYKKSITVEEYPAKPHNVIILLLLGLLPLLGVLSVEFLGRFAGYITGVFFNLRLILLFTFLYLIINYKRISRWYLIVLSGLIMIFVLLNTLGGSRGALLKIAIFLLIGFLAVKKRITINKKLVLLGLLLVPLSVVFFISATCIRQSAINQRVISTQQLDVLKESDAFKFRNIGLLCRPILDRIGFLDYSTDSIQNKKLYRKIINTDYYFKSIVDNCLTPGFNVFGTPKMANALMFIHRGYSSVTYTDVVTAYHSDMPTLYGEYYVLFRGYPALFVFFILSYMFKRCYLSIKSKDTFLFYLYRSVILYVFYLWVNSFGMDWMVLDLISTFITVGLFKNFYKMRKRKVKSVCVA